jgi:hypothetical protein
MRLRDVQNPANALSGKNVDITSVVVSTIDTFDETHDGKSIGSVFVQDADIAGPFGGISMYEPAYIPANLRVSPGDVLNLSGEYLEEATIGSTVNFAPNFLPQMNKPQVELSFELTVPTPVVINLSDLNTFATGRQWIGMLVQIQNVTVLGAPTADGTTGRVTAAFSNLSDGPEINNELFDLQAWNGSNTSNSFPAGTTFASITGVVDFFFNLFICPRSEADLVPQ